VCPKLEILHLETDSLEATSFLSIFKRFLDQATNLREFRYIHVRCCHCCVPNLNYYSFVNIFSLVWDHKELTSRMTYPLTALRIIKALLQKSPLLERLVLIDGGSKYLPFLNLPHKYPDLFRHFLQEILQFASKMTHLSCCVLTFNYLTDDFMKVIKERVEEEVVSVRPSLWFYLDRKMPEPSDGSVPSVHYHEIVEPVSFVLPRL